MIGFGNGDFYKLYSKREDSISDKYINVYKADGLAEAIELNCPKEEMIDCLLEKQIDLSFFNFVSLHAPALEYGNNNLTERVFNKLERINKKYKVDNFIFHTDTVLDWESFKSLTIPVSIENMDNRKSTGQKPEDLRRVLDKYDFRLTLDLQHCFVNDNSMKLALNFQEEFGDKIVEYHISGADKNLYHFPLFKTKQKAIIKSLKNKEKPIIIESAFDEIGEENKEIKYIKSLI